MTGRRPSGALGILLAAHTVGLACACGGARATTTPRPTSIVAGPLWLGDTARYPLAILGVAYGPDRVSLLMGQAAYVTAVAVTADRIEALVPSSGKESQILEAGPQVVTLGADVSAPKSAGIPDNNGSAAAQMEYDRCMAAARNANAARAARSRRQVGTDSKGNPIYEEVHVEYTDPRLDYENRCRMPAVNGAAAAAPRRAGTRYLLVFASDAPASSQDIVGLVVTAGDARSTALAIGDKLFTARGARWSASLLPW